MKEVIMKVPSFSADYPKAPIYVADLVRCKECKYKQQCHKAVEHTTRDATSVTIAYRPIDFCSYGERKESE